MHRWSLHGMLWLLLLIVLLVIVFVYINKCRSNPELYKAPVRGGKPIEQPINPHADEPTRDVLVYYEKDADVKSLKQGFAKVKGVTPVYNVTRPSDYSNVPVIWVGSTCTRASDFQRANPGVCSAIILWHPTSHNKLGPESAAYTFIVLDVAKRGQDNEWSEYSHHRYYIPKGPVHSHIADILSMIR